MEDPGHMMKRKRESLGLKYRDVEVASNVIAQSKSSDEFIINISRLSDIENKGTVPSIFRLYSLSTIYRMDMREALDWYGVSVASQPADALMLPLAKTHVIGFPSPSWGDVQMPITLDPGIDLKQTKLLNRLIQRWGKMPLSLLGNVELRSLTYGFIGTEDWRMYPLIYPESVVLIDPDQKKISSSGSLTEYDRPIYFVEHRSGFYAGWCSVTGKQLILMPHPASRKEPVLLMADETDVIGQVIGVANYFALNRSLPMPDED